MTERTARVPGMSWQEWNRLDRTAPAGLVRARRAGPMEVAAGITPIAMAPDGGGPIRIPATSSGLVALKPARGCHRNM